MFQFPLYFGKQVVKITVMASEAVVIDGAVNQKIAHGGEGQGSGLHTGKPPTLPIPSGLGAVSLRQEQPGVVGEGPFCHIHT